MLFGRPDPAAGQSLPDEQDAQAWVQVLAIEPVSENWRAHLELQPRIFDNVSELGLTLVRTAIGRQVAPRVTAWIGHAWVPRSLGPITRHEQRIWQQLSLVLPSGARWTNTARIRLEQRWLAPWADASHRLRLMARAQRTVGSNGRWGLTVFDEAMITFDTTLGGPARGYDRNRLFGGVSRRLSPALAIDAGYLWENSTIPGPLQRNDHVALTIVNVAFPRGR